VNHSSPSGREQFDRYGSFIGAIESVNRYLPKIVFHASWIVSRPWATKTAVVLRYFVAQRLAKSCGQVVQSGPNVTVKSWGNLELGSRVNVHENCYIDASGGVNIGSDVSIAHGSSVLSFNHTWQDPDTPIKYNPLEYKSVAISDDVWIGCGVRVLAGAQLSSRVIIAAGAVVTPGDYKTRGAGLQIYYGIHDSPFGNMVLASTDRGIQWRAVFVLVAKLSGATLLVLLLSLVFMFGHDMLTQCDYFKAKTVSVSGNSRISAKQIKSVSGIYEGKNILSVNMLLARKKLLAIPWIKQVDIRRDFPSGMTIHVDENHPKAIVDFGRFFLINTDGNVFMEVKPADFPKLPVIHGVEYDQWNPDQGKTRAFQSVMSVLRLAEKGDGPFHTRDLKEIDVDPETGVTLLTETAVEKILLGFGDYGQKVGQLSKIMSLPETVRRYSAFYMMDLRNPERVVARPRPASKEALSA